jgi:hypothetical protein
VRQAAVTAVLAVGLAVLAVSGVPAGEKVAPKPAPKTPPKAPPKPPAPPVLREKSLAGPLKNVDEIVFATRSRYDDGHWYANIGYYCEDANAKAYAGNGKPDVGTLCAWNIRTGQTRVLLDAKGGSVRDPQLYYDGRKILFSYRKAGTDYFHLYEIGVDGSGLRELTTGPFDDFEPTYLPDGDILFVSTRCRRWVSCWKTHVGIMHRCGPNGGDIRPVSCNIEHDNTPWVLPDGRILYMRWEYVDRSQMDFHHLWVMFPDGTGQTVYYGNMQPGTVMLDAKPIPGTQKIVASFSPGHGVNEHAGRLTIVSPEPGPDAPAAVQTLTKGLVRDPFPFSEQWFLAAQDNRIVLVDGGGAIETLYAHPDKLAVHEPRPVMARAREPVLADRTQPALPTGRMVVADVYHGRNLPGVQRGEIKKLLVLEVLPKPVNFSGGMDLTSWLGTFNLERVLGTVPVEEDGSASFDVPAGRPVFFVALDKNDLSVKRMQSFTTAMPGETVSCVGCHEQRTATPVNRGHGTLKALQRPPSKIEAFDGFPSVLDFNRDVQPILDEHCVSCHNPRKRDGKVLLSGDIGPSWSHSYYSLIASLQVVDGRNGLGNQPPRSIGSAASPLMKKLDGSHYKAKVSERQWRMLWLWLESGAPYAGTYAGLRNAKAEATGHGVAGQNVFGPEHDVLRRRCAQCHDLGKDEENAKRPLPFHYKLDRNERRKEFQRPTAVYERLIVKDDPQLCYSAQILLNLSRPELSSLLQAPLAKEAGGWGSCGVVFKDASDPDYKRLLGGIHKAKAAVEAEQQFGTPQFRPNHQYIREMKRFGILPAGFDPTKDPVDAFATDEKYWRLFWYAPANARNGQ